MASKEIGLEHHHHYQASSSTGGQILPRRGHAHRLDATHDRRLEPRE